VVQNVRPVGLENAYRAWIARKPAEEREVVAETRALDRLFAMAARSSLLCENNDVEGHEQF
jgi:hypothetical protein